MKAALPTPTFTPRTKQGIVVMEVLIALLIYGMAAVALMQAIISCAKTAVVAQQELRMLLRLQSRLNEVSKDPDIARLYEDPPKASDPDEFGVWTAVEITKFENEFTEKDKQEVKDMYHIKVTAYYDYFGEKNEVIAETDRYARLYATRGGAASNAPPPANAPQ